MTKTDRIADVFANIETTQKEAARIVEIIFGSVVRAYAPGDKVEIRVSGVFGPVHLRGAIKGSHFGRRERAPRTSSARRKHTSTDQALEARRHKAEGKDDWRSTQVDTLQRRPREQ